jgi:Protein of unknown function (DUF3726)
VLTVSLNEVESTALKAARGAGLPWGTAEETGRAARWLAARELPWAASLVSILEDTQEGRIAGIEPGQADTQALCPIRAGIHICDFVCLQSGFTFQGVVHPLWLLPFMDAAVVIAGKPIEMRWPGGTVVITPGQSFGPMGRSVLELARIWQSDVAVEVKAAAPSAQAPKPSPKPFEGSVVDPASWRGLQRFERLTYVPASDISRLAGAGAGLKDND